MPTRQDDVENRDKVYFTFALEPSLRGHMSIFRIISQPRALFSDVPASQKGVYFFYNLLINFFISNMLGEKEKQEVNARANDTKKHID